MVVQKYCGHHQHMKSLPLAAGVDPSNSLLPQFEALHPTKESHERSKVQHDARMCEEVMAGGRTYDPCHHALLHRKENTRCKALSDSTMSTPSI